MRESDKALSFAVVDSTTGKTDKVELVTNHSVSRRLRHASSGKSESVSLTLSEGSLSTFWKSL